MSTRAAEKLALICDCDGVLIDSESAAGAMLLHELEARWPGLDVASVLIPLLGLRTEHVLEATASALGKTLTRAEIETIHGTVQAAAIKAPMVGGVDTALANIPLMKACASNSFSDYVRTVLDRTGLIRFFPGRYFTADMVLNPKPEPDVYLLAARCLAVDPAHCLVVEDSVAGATAAVAAGMTVLGFAGGAHEPEAQGKKLRGAGAVRVFYDMKQLPDLAERWIEELGFTRPFSAAEKGDLPWQA